MQKSNVAFLLSLTHARIYLLDSYPPDFRWTFLHNRWYHAACAAHPTNREKVALCADRRLMGASCRLATVRLAKTVRLSVDRAAELLRDLPGLKVTCGHHATTSTSTDGSCPPLL